MICPNCQAQIADGKKFCPKCGASLTGSSEAEKLPDSTSSLCPQCQSPLLPGKQFCADCEHKNAQGVEANSEPHGPSSPRDPLPSSLPLGASQPAGLIAPSSSKLNPHDTKAKFPWKTTGIALTLLIVGVVIWVHHPSWPATPAQNAVNSTGTASGAGTSENAVPAVPSGPPGQVHDLRPPQVSLLNPPVLRSSPVVSANPQNIQGTITLKSDSDGISIIYPSGAVFRLGNLFKTNGPASAKFNNDYGTMSLDSTGMGENDSSTWQVQFQSDQARDINGDGFPEIVLNDYSGGAHCCTSVAVLSLRPQGAYLVFAQGMGSAEAEFRDIRGDGRREILFHSLAEYALGDFAGGTYGVPVVYAADENGVYQINTKAYPTVLEREYQTAKDNYSKAQYNSGSDNETEDRDLINLFSLAYLMGNRDEAFSYLSQIKPLTNNASNNDPLAILEKTLQQIAPEVLESPEWVNLRSRPQINSVSQHSEDVDAGVHAALQHWAETMRSNTPSQIAACYAQQVDRYFLRLNVTNDFIRDYMTKWLATRRVAKFELVEISPEEMTTNAATLSVIKDTTEVEGGSSTEKLVHSRLSLKREDGQWKISSERDFK